MGAVTQRIANYLGGISKQSDDQMKPGTVNECRNAYPDATFGLCKRPGFEFIYTLRDDQVTVDDQGNIIAPGNIIDVPEFDGSFWFSLLRFTPESSDRNPYMGCITPATYTQVGNNPPTLENYGKLYLWNAANPTAMIIIDNSSYLTAADPVNDYEYIAEQSAVIITNKRMVVTPLTDITSINYVGAFTNYAELILHFDDAANTPSNGDIVKILNSNVPEDDYWLQYDNGAWEECRGLDLSGQVPQGIDKGLTPNTMPHRLVVGDTSADTSFGVIQWQERGAGDKVSNPDPSFVGKTINQTFIYQNRLGILSEDNCVLSRATLNITDAAYNFFRQSALTLTPADPIDLKTSSVTPAHLIRCIPQSSGLLLFSTNAIYVLTSEGGTLSPTTYLVRQLSAVEIAEEVSPVAMGTDIVFINKTLSYSRAIGVTTQGYQEHPLVRDFSKTIEELIPSSVNRLTANTQSEKVCAYTIDGEELFFYSTYDPGDQDNIRAWYVWDVPGNIKTMIMWRDQVLVIVERGGTYHFINARLTRSNLSVIDTQTGIKANPHLDFFFQPDTAIEDPADELKTIVTYNWGGTFTEPPTLIMVDDGNPLTFSSGLIREAVSTTATTMTVEDPDGYIRNNINLARVGYKFTMDVRIPRIYYSMGEGLYDTTAQLTVSRAKFTVGRSGSCGFKITSRGNQVQKFIQTDPTRTTFPIDFNFEDQSSNVPSDVDRIVVVVSGVRQLINEDYTISVTREVVFNTAPAENAVIVFSLNNEKFTVYEIPVADQYNLDSPALGGQSIEKRMFTVPIHQKNDNFYLSIFTDTPLPVSINSMSWEGMYSPRFYARS